MVFLASEFHSRIGWFTHETSQRIVDDMAGFLVLLLVRCNTIPDFTDLNRTIICLFDTNAKISGIIDVVGVIMAMHIATESGH